MPQPLLFRMIDKAVYDYHLIEKGDKILVGASGGKDSTALIQYFARRKLRPQEDFTYTALHVQSEITPPLNTELQQLFEQWKVPVETLDVDVLHRVKPGHKMNCWWCSTQRRTELLRYALNNGYTKLALGHHLDDILETLLMNMMNKAELATMPPRLQYEKYPLVIIRPLCYAPVDIIKEHGKQEGYITTTCTCTYQDNSGRKEARSRLEALTGGDNDKKEKLFRSLRNIKKEYLP
ncbi:MAG: tRNA 2-thiocytidine biosynthesis TtcA family protein [Treponema sp.]|nr:tRNA 2-thiocytidine biosynthesis TtcA family protein [Treponema sp.]